MSMLLETGLIINEYQSNKLFNGVLAASQLLGILTVLSAALWMGGYNEGGFSWTDDPERQFHYHPMFMSMGMIFLLGEAIIVYRVFRHERKRFTKLLHIVIHTSTIIFMLTALKAVFDSHNYHRDPGTGELKPIPNLMSLHSWIGMLTVLGYFMQYIIGFITFFIPGLDINVRKFTLPFHQLFGIMLMLAVTGTALVGISERAAWKHTCWTKQGELCGQQLMANFLGLCIVGYTACVLFIVLNPRWKRKPLPEEECLYPVND
uniref:Cytochrome b561 domain-containing protein n=1 Tax=Panagrellus redivivus TaxID=6233 RepID=A0A7E4WB18_PANRE